MAEITLVRHGQASFGAADYDCLSELGAQQSHWLGEHFRETGEQFDRVVMGGLRRHEQTAQGVLQGMQQSIAPEPHAGLNEYNFSGLLKPYKELKPEQWRESDHIRRDYFYNMRAALTCWFEGSIADDGFDSWQHFCTRIRSGFDFACRPGAKRILVISSGGPIGVILGDVLGLETSKVCDLTLHVKNTAASKLLYNRTDFTLDSFNDVSHLRSAQRQHGITFT